MRPDAPAAGGAPGLGGGARAGVAVGCRGTERPNGPGAPGLGGARAGVAVECGSTERPGRVSGQPTDRALASG